MSERVETVEVVGEDGGKLIINKSDFDKEKHEEFKTSARKTSARKK